MIIWKRCKAVINRSSQWIYIDMTDRSIGSCSCQPMVHFSCRTVCSFHQEYEYGHIETQRKSNWPLNHDVYTRVSACSPRFLQLPSDYTLAKYKITSSAYPPRKKDQKSPNSRVKRPIAPEAILPIQRPQIALSLTPRSAALRPIEEKLSLSLSLPGAITIRARASRYYNNQKQPAGPESKALCPPENACDAISYF